MAITLGQYRGTYIVLAHFTSTIWLKNGKERITYQAHSLETSYNNFESKTLRLTLHRIPEWTSVGNLSDHRGIS